jgi:hypothetical protein
LLAALALYLVSFGSVAFSLGFGGVSIPDTPRAIVLLYTPIWSLGAAVPPLGNAIGACCDACDHLGRRLAGRPPR